MSGPGHNQLLPTRAFAPLEDDVFRLLVDSVRDYGIFLLDPDGYVQSWNVGAARIKGYTAAEIIGRHFSTFYPADAVATGWPAIELERAIADGRFEDEGWRVRKDGSRFWANVVITALVQRDGTLRGFAKVTRDLTDRRQHEETLRRSEERFRLLVEGVRDYAIFMLDPTGAVQTWNSGAELINGYAAHEIIGRHFSAFYPSEQLAANWPAYELERATAEGRYEEEGWRVRKGGAYFWASVVITALRDPAGTLIGFAKVTRDLTQRRRVEQLEADSRRMNEFLAMLAHELRNPLAPIRNAASLLARSPSDASRTSWAAGIIERQAAHLSRLVDDLLDVSRITQGKIEIEQVPVDLGEVVARAIEAARPYVEARRHTLEVSTDDGVFVAGDLYRLTQVVTNLLHNAAKFTPDGGGIFVTLKGGRRAELRVRDTGEGMPADLVPRVFDLFAQGDGGIDRSKGGLGLGLTIVRRLVEMHGGAIDARSEGPGRGSEFRIVLPALSRKLLPQDAAGSPDAPAVAAEADGLNVMIVDDNVDATNSMRILLELSGHRVAVANDGESAVPLAERFRPDVVLLDIGLPGKSGYDVAREIRARQELAHAHIVAVTGYGQPSDRERAIEAGFDDHLVKPVDPDTLLAEIAKLRAARDAAQATPASNPGTVREK